MREADKGRTDRSKERERWLEWKWKRDGERVRGEESFYMQRGQLSQKSERQKPRLSIGRFLGMYLIRLAFTLYQLDITEPTSCLGWEELCFRRKWGPRRCYCRRRRYPRRTKIIFIFHLPSSGKYWCKFILKSEKFKDNFHF